VEPNDSRSPSTVGPRRLEGRGRSPDVPPAFNRLSLERRIHSGRSGPHRTGARTMQRCLIVANQTLTTDTLSRAVQDRMSAEPHQFYVVAPATPSHTAVRACTAEIRQPLMVGARSPKSRSRGTLSRPPGSCWNPRPSPTQPPLSAGALTPCSILNACLALAATAAASCGLPSRARRGWPPRLAMWGLRGSTTLGRDGPGTHARAW
jgi:hypothetical protein